MCGFTSRAVVAAAFSLFMFQAPAQAGSAFGAWVSVAGQDVSGCGSPTSPCRTFQYAHDNVLGANGGEILVQGAGDFGPLNITKSVSVLNNGSGSATASGVVMSAIDVNTTGNVLLSGLTLDGAGVSYIGVNVHGPANVTIVNCTVQNFLNSGIFFDASAGDVNFSIQDTLAQNNAGYGVGVGGRDSPTSVRGNISNAKLLGNNWGFSSGGVANVLVEIADSFLSNNSGSGLILSQGANTVALRRSTITGNLKGYYFDVGPSTIQTYGDNVIANNGSNQGTLTPVSTQ